MTSKTNGVALVGTLHDPDNRLYDLTRERFPALAAIYSAISVLCSAATHYSIIALLEKNGAMVRKEGRRPAGYKGLGRVRREALQAGLAAGTPHFHLCDFDRVLHWVGSHPDEMPGMLQDVSAHDFLITGRTVRAFETHPPVQKATEEMTNIVFNKLYGEDVDLSGGSRGISRQAARVLLTHSREETVGVEGEWPIILKRYPELKRGFRRYEGLEFESADAREEEIARAGGYDAWVANVLGTPESWLMRIEMTHDTIAAALRAARSGTQEAE